MVSNSTEGRLILTGHQPAVMNMAIDEALARLSLVPTFRYYGWQPSAVSIGYFQRIEREIDLEVASSKGMDVIRRITGGGAVYHDMGGEVTYSITLSESLPNIPKDVQESYHILCNGITKGLSKLGLDTVFHPVNDIICNGRKISGNAQTRRFGKVLQHGTILMKVDPALMFSVLKVPDEKIRDKMISFVEERVTSFEKEGVEVNFEKTGKALTDGFSEMLGIDFVPDSLTASEKALAERLVEEKYSTRGWNHRR